MLDRVGTPIGNPGNAGNAMGNPVDNPGNAGDAMGNPMGNPGNAGNGMGNPGNAGNAMGMGSLGNAFNQKKGAVKKRAGKRRGLKRSANVALVVKKQWLDLIFAGDKDWKIRGSSTSNNNNHNRQTN